MVKHSLNFFLNKVQKEDNKKKSKEIGKGKVGILYNTNSLKYQV